MKNQSGQILVVLLLVMLAALTVGLAITQRTVSDVSTSTQVEQSSRAFSAAEAGIERAISLSTSGIVNVTSDELNNDSSAQVVVEANIPTPGDTRAVEYPGSNVTTLTRESVAQFWLADPTTFGTSYDKNQVTIYFGDPNDQILNNPNDTTTPAIEVNYIYAIGANYFSRRSYYDPNNGRGAVNRLRSSQNDISSPNCGGYSGINTTVSASSSFKCSLTLATQAAPVMLRIRLLYAPNNEKVAVQPCFTCGVFKSLPPQVDVLASRGQSGLSQKVINAYRFRNVALPFFDYAIFSAANITKN
jgi:hypothetical protein